MTNQVVSNEAVVEAFRADPVGVLEALIASQGGVAPLLTTVASTVFRLGRKADGTRRNAYYEIHDRLRALNRTVNRDFAPI